MTTIKTHYVYKITNLNPIDEQQFYIGVHSDKKPDSLNDGYMGSSKYLNNAMKSQGKEKFKKEILSWATREEAMVEEIRLHGLFDVAKNKIFYNKSNANMYGLDFVYKPIGIVSVIDIATGDTMAIPKVEFDNNPNKYIHINVDKVVVMDIATGDRSAISKAEFDNSTNKYASVGANIIKIYDSCGILQYTSFGSFPKFCESHRLPKTLKNSYLNNGKPLYQNPNKSTLTYITKNNLLQFKGWYAIKD